MDPWQSEFADQLPRLGHRNWIIVADAAFPEQCATGVKVIVAGSPLDETLKHVLTSIQDAGHVTPVVLLDRELGYLTDELCPGVSAMRDSIRFDCSDLRISDAAHESILEMLSMDGANYTVLVIKTSSMIPYTSVFLRLDCGYWDSDREAILRGMM